MDGVKSIVKILSQCKPGEARAPIEKELLSKFTSICQDALIELQYSLLLISNEVSSLSPSLSFFLSCMCPCASCLFRRFLGSFFFRVLGCLL